jgi:sec-independent protein translocase protein TatC
MTTAEEIGGPRLTIYEHLAELRTRLLWSLGALAVGMILAFQFNQQIIALIQEPALVRLQQTIPDLTARDLFIFTELTGNISVVFQVTLVSGLIIAFPVILYQIIAFIAPAMTQRERRYFFILMPVFFVLMFAGVLFSYYIILPAALEFLLTFNTGGARPQIRIDDYVDKVAKITLWLGLTFQLPLIMYFLALIRVIDPWKVAWFLRYALVLSFVAGAIVTPTFDPLNQTLFALPTFALYIVGWGATWLAWRGRPRPVKK